MHPRRPRLRVAALTSAFAIAAAGVATAARLPIRAYGIEDGLPSTTTACIVPDRRGLLWVCTSEGLARFDGTTFRTYTTADGLPHRLVTAFLEARDGTYWVGTAAGLAHFEPGAASRGTTAPSPLFTVVPYPGRTDARDGPLRDYVFTVEEQPVYALHQDPFGTLWCGTGAGLFRIDRANGAWALVPAGIDVRPPAIVQALLTDRRGRLWIGANSGLYRRSPDGRLVHFGNDGFLAPGVNHNVVKALLEDREGRIWVGTDFSGLRLLSPDAEPGSGIVANVWLARTDTAGDRAAGVVQASDGSIWWVGLRGLNTLRRRSDPDWRDAEWQSFGTASGLTRARLDQVALDAHGNLWLGGDSSGLMRLTPGGFQSFTEDDGLASRAVHAITGAADGSVVVVTEQDRGPWHHNRFDGRRFESVRFNVPHNDWGWGWSQLAFEDASHRWWVPTGQSAFRSPAVPTFAALGRAPWARFASPSGAPAWAVFRLFPDSHGFVWAGTMDRVAGLETRNELARWNAETDRFEPFPNDDMSFVPMAFAEDTSGGVWIGGYSGGLRRAAMGSRRLEDRSALAPAGQVRALLVDHRGRLWVGASEGGLARIDAPEQGMSITRRYGLAEGLASADIWSLVEDTIGRIYVGHARGVDVIDVEGGLAASFTSVDGLAPGAVWCAYRDATGALWFGTLAGLSRFVPGAFHSVVAPRIAVTAVSVGGRRLPVSEVGETTVQAFEVPPDSPPIDIQFTALGASAPADVRYQFMLESGDNHWGLPSPQRAVVFARLAAGSYRFLVRAVSPGGAVLSDVATVPFQVLRPVWARWWFVSLAVFGLSMVLYLWHRVGVARAVAVERVRLRIARDLHDEVGGSLSRLAILGEVAQRDPSRVSAVLADVAATARALVETMSEVVWLVDPRKDDLASVIDLLAAHGRELFEPQNVTWTCTMPAEAAAVKLSSEARRELYLILKEAVTNAARHSGCSRAELVVEVRLRTVVVEVRDNGHGFAPAASPAVGHGNGLPNMQARAASIGAAVTMPFTPAGTVVRVVAPR